LGPSTPLALPAPAPHAGPLEQLAEVEPLGVPSGVRVIAPEEPAEPSAGLPASATARDLVQVELRVLGLRAGEPATVEIWSADGSPASRPTGTLVVHLEAGDVRASAWTEDLCSEVGREFLRPGRESQTFTLALEPCGMVEGQVVEAALGRPLAGVRVALSTNREAPAHTDSAGWYRLRRARDGMSHLVECAAAGYASDSAVLSFRADGRWSVERVGPSGLLTTAGTGLARVDLALHPVRTLTGRVVDPGGSPLDGASVRVQGYYRQGKSASTPNGGTKATGPDGLFEFSGLRPDITHQVRITTADFATALVAVPPAPGSVLDLGTIVLENQASLAGRLFDARGEPVAGLEIRLEPGPAAAPGLAPRDSLIGAEELRRERDFTSVNGTFVFTRLASGAYRIVVRSDHRSIHEVDLELASAEHRRETITLGEQYLDIQGVVLSPTGPVPGAEVELDLAAGRSTRSAADGSFQFNGLGRPDAIYRLRAEWRDERGKSWSSPIVGARPGGPLARLELVAP
jgi:hypothetical protein